MADLKEQRICIKFYFDLEKPPCEIYEILQKAFFDDAMCRPQTFVWYSRVKIGQTSVKIWNVQVIHCEGAAVKMWKKRVKSSMRLARPIIQYMLMNFNQRFKHEAGCWKICALSADW
jgi:hypothetical protein